MGRAPLTIGSFGDITTRILPSGRFEARTRYRDWDGRSRIVQATADTAKAAERALKEKPDRGRRSLALVARSVTGLPVRSIDE